MVGDTDAKGWPDLVLVHPGIGRILFRELKSDKGNPTPEQTEWLTVLRTSGLDACVWRPGDWDNDIVPVLTLRRKAA